MEFRRVLFRSGTCSRGGRGGRGNGREHDPEVRSGTVCRHRPAGNFLLRPGDILRLRRGGGGGQREDRLLRGGDRGGSPRGRSRPWVRQPPRPFIPSKGGGCPGSGIGGGIR